MLFAACASAVWTVAALQAAPVELFTERSVARAARTLRTGVGLESEDEQLAPGLKEAHVRAYARLLKMTHGVNLLELEMEGARQAFVQSATKLDEPGKRYMLETGPALRKAYGETSRPERKRQITAELDQALAELSSQGVDWASFLKAAIDRRASVVLRVKGDPPAFASKDKRKLDREISESDLDATVEAVIFMWMQVGRVAERITPEGAKLFRARLAKALPELSTDWHWIIANIEGIVPRARYVFTAFGEEEKAMYARQMLEFLNILGLDDSNGWADGGSRAHEAEWPSRSGLFRNVTWSLADRLEIEPDR